MYPHKSIFDMNEVEFKQMISSLEAKLGTEKLEKTGVYREKTIRRVEESENLKEMWVQERFKEIVDIEKRREQERDKIKKKCSIL